MSLATRALVAEYNRWRILAGRCDDPVVAPERVPVLPMSRRQRKRAQMRLWLRCRRRDLGDRFALPLVYDANFYASHPGKVLRITLPE